MVVRGKRKTKMSLISTFDNDEETEATENVGFVCSKNNLVEIPFETD